MHNIHQVKVPQDLQTIHIPAKSTGKNAQSIWGKPICPIPHKNVEMRTENIPAPSAFSVHTGLVYSQTGVHKTSSTLTTSFTLEEAATGTCKTCRSNKNSDALACLKWLKDTLLIC